MNNHHRNIVDRHRSRPPGNVRERGGLTLLEIAVVMSIMATVSGLALYGIFAARERTPLTSTEHLLRSTIRQARQTAQSTGLPVEISIDKESRTITGLTNTYIIGENFEAQPGQGQSLERPLPRQATASWIVTPGYSGYGWSLGIRDIKAGGLRADRPLPLPLSAPRGSRILSKDGDGFTVSAFFKPAYLDDDRGANIRPVDVVSLVDTKELSTSITLQLAVHRENGVNAWYYPRGEIRTPAGRGNIEDPSLRLNGDAWYHLVMTYDGSDMRLLVNERPAQKTVAVPGFRFSGPPGVAVGSEPTGNRPVGVVDNVRLVAAGTGSPIQLPGNVEPAEDYRILLTATDVQVISQSQSGQQRLQFHSSSDGPVLNATVTASGMLDVTLDNAPPTSSQSAQQSAQ